MINQHYAFNIRELAGYTDVDSQAGVSTLFREKLLSSDRATAFSSFYFFLKAIDQDKDLMLTEAELQAALDFLNEVIAGLAHEGMDPGKEQVEKECIARLIELFEYFDVEQKNTVRRGHIKEANRVLLILDELGNQDGNVDVFEAGLLLHNLSF